MSLGFVGACARKRVRLGRAWVVPAGAAFAAVLTRSATASAQNFLQTDFGPGIAAVSGVLSLPPLVGNSVYVIRQVRPPTVWPILGFVFGALDIAGGLGFAIPNASSSDSSASLKVGLGLGLVGEGALNVGLGAWALTLSPARTTAGSERELGVRWSVAPLVAKDVGGRFHYGAALSVGHFLSSESRAAVQARNAERERFLIPRLRDGCSSARGAW